MSFIISNKESGSKKEPFLSLELLPEVEEAYETLLKQLEADNNLAHFKNTTNSLCKLYPNSPSVKFLQGYACIKPQQLHYIKISI